DVQLHLVLGGVALREWAGPTGRVLVKTSEGARLVGDPWHRVVVFA
ncbi:malonate decarboxylase holo-[acyl-carrier-protein] synthase, partial [Pseudomonas syringae pv. tagetis]